MKTETQHHCRIARGTISSVACRDSYSAFEETRNCLPPPPNRKRMRQSETLNRPRRGLHENVVRVIRTRARVLSIVSRHFLRRCTRAGKISSAAERHRGPGGGDADSLRDTVSRWKTWRDAMAADPTNFRAASHFRSRATRTAPRRPALHSENERPQPRPL